MFMFSVKLLPNDTFTRQGNIKHNNSESVHAHACANTYDRSIFHSSGNGLSSCWDWADLYIEILCFETTESYAMAFKNERKQLVFIF